MIKYVTGDLLAADEPHIAHGCNTHGVMGAGIAGAIARKWPEVERVNRAACRLKEFHLGSCQPVFVHDVDRTVYNLGTQRAPGRDGSYWAVMLAMGNLMEYCVANAIDRVAIPRIGCGIAGLEWKTVEWLINGIYDYIPHGPDVVVYTLAEEGIKFTC